MSTLATYYSMNQIENPYTMKLMKDTSRVHILQRFIPQYTKFDRTILDVGCGDMYLSRELPQFNWVGLDINMQVNGGKCTKWDLEKIPYPYESHSFDTIVCSEVLEHLYDPVMVTKEIKRLLKPQGTYILSTPNLDWAEHFMNHFRPLLFDPKKSWTKEHIHQYNLESHDKILGEAGFKRVDYTGADPHFGAFYPAARGPLSGFLRDKLGLTEEAALIQADLLLSSMFKDWLHTIVIVAKPI